MSMTGINVTRVQNPSPLSDRIVVTTPEHVDVADLIARRLGARLYILPNKADTADEIRPRIRSLVRRRSGSTGPERPALTLLGPARIALGTERGDEYKSDLAYGDIDGDGIVEVPVGRLPANRTLALRMLNRSDRRARKDAFVASAYRYSSWPLVLGSVGGGMWAGKSVEHVLEQQGYDVARAAERRTHPEQFLRSLTPARMTVLLQEASTVRNALAPVLGTGVATAASTAYVTVLGLRYGQRALAQYLEFDWSTAGLDIGRGSRRLEGLGITAPRTVKVVKGGVAGAAETDSLKGVVPGLVGAL
ncbi:MAG: hypothetical protein ABEK12_02160, partial [Candidatus Nanohaloarchaea archaeon]